MDSRSHVDSSSLKKRCHRDVGVTSRHGEDSSQLCGVSGDSNHSRGHHHHHRRNAEYKDYHHHHHRGDFGYNCAKKNNDIPLDRFNCHGSDHRYDFRSKSYHHHYSRNLYNDGDDEDDHHRSSHKRDSDYRNGKRYRDRSTSRHRDSRRRWRSSDRGCATSRQGEREKQSLSSSSTSLKGNGSKQIGENSEFCDDQTKKTTSKRLEESLEQPLEETLTDRDEEDDPEKFLQAARQRRQAVLEKYRATREGSKLEDHLPHRTIKLDDDDDDGNDSQFASSPNASLTSSVENAEVAISGRASPLTSFSQCPAALDADGMAAEEEAFLLAAAEIPDDEDDEDSISRCQRVFEAEANSPVVDRVHSPPTAFEGSTSEISKPMSLVSL